MWRVSWKWPPTGTPRIETRSTSRATGRGVATPIVSASTTSPVPAATSRSARSATTPGSTSPSNGQPNEQLIVAVAGRSAAARIRSDPRGRLLERRVPVALVEGLRRGERDVDPVEAGRPQPLPAALVQDEPGELAPRRRGRSDDLLRARHLRHALVADEADRLDPRQPARRQPPHEVGPDARRERLRLVLEPVAGPDVAEGDTHRGEGTVRLGAAP